jgi:hypothetical protein
LGEWTIFYWAWWFAWAPFCGIFIARISKGRKIKEVVAVGLLANFLRCHNPCGRYVHNERYGISTKVYRGYMGNNHWIALNVIGHCWSIKGIPDCIHINLFAIHSYLLSYGVFLGFQSVQKVK